MLVLSRQIGQRCRLTVPGELLKSGEPLVIDVVLVGIRGLNRGRLGFDGAREIEVDRPELFDSQIPKVSVSP